MMNGVTIDRIDDFQKTLDAYDKIPGQRAARLVCDRGLGPIHYQDFARRLRPRGKLVMLPVDSFATRLYDLADYKQRYQKYALAMTPSDILEVNEVNGDWCGKHSAEKAQAGIEAAQARGLQSLLTLYLEGTDLSSLWKWLDWNYAKVGNATIVGLSYYPRQQSPNVNAWKPIFDELGMRFPRARLVLSEVGPEKYDDNDKPVPATDQETEAVINGYCGIHVAHPRYDGGCFYWDFVRDMVAGKFLPQLVRAYSREA